MHLWQVHKDRGKKGKIRAGQEGNLVQQEFQFPLRLPPSSGQPRLWSDTTPTLPDLHLHTAHRSRERWWEMQPQNVREKHTQQYNLLLESLFFYSPF